jgi:hypothetical protein
MKLTTIEKCAANNLSATPSAQDILDAGAAASTLSLQVGSSCFEAPRQIGGKANLPVCRKGCPFHEVAEVTMV